MNEHCSIKIYYNKLWLMPLAHQELHAIIKTMLKHAPSEIGSFLHINVVDDATIAEINADYLCCHGPTNILSFPVEAISNNAISNNAISNNAISNNAISNNAISNNAISNNAIFNNAISNNAISNNAISNNDIANIFFSIDTFYRECFLYKQEPLSHLLWLFAHAMGHLCHMDHSPEMDKVCSDLYNACLFEVASI